MISIILFLQFPLTLAISLMHTNHNILPQNYYWGNIILDHVNECF